MLENSALKTLESYIDTWEHKNYIICIPASGELVDTELKNLLKSLIMLAVQYHKKHLLEALLLIRIRKTMFSNGKNKKNPLLRLVANI